MSYLDRYVRGSLGGAAFYTESMTTSFGRRVAIYELPFSEKGVAHVDLGRASREFRIRAILLGEDYDRDRDKLIKVFEKPGAQLLVHPTLGRSMVMVRPGAQITESTSEGGLAEVEFTAIEARDPLPPASGLSLLDSAQNLRDAASDNLLVKLLTTGPDFLTEDVFTTLDSVARDLTILNAQIGAWLAVPGNLASKIDRISLQLASLIDTPRKLFDAIDNFLGSLMASISRMTNALTQEDLAASVRQSALRRSIRQLGNLGAGYPPVPPTQTVARNQQRRNRAAVMFAIKASALANAAAAMAEIPSDSRTEALDIAGVLAQALTELADSNMDGEEVSAEMYEALKDLAALVEQLADAAGVEGSVQIISTSDATAFVVLAYRLYGDASRYEELQARNPQVMHPGAVPASERVEVLDR